MKLLENMKLFNQFSISFRDFTYLSHRLHALRVFTSNQLFVEIQRLPSQRPPITRVKQQQWLSLSLLPPRALSVDTDCCRLQLPSESVLCALEPWVLETHGKRLVKMAPHLVTANSYAGRILWANATRKPPSPSLTFSMIRYENSSQMAMGKTLTCFKGGSLLMPCQICAPYPDQNRKLP